MANGNNAIAASARASSIVPAALCRWPSLIPSVARVGRKVLTPARDEELRGLRRELDHPWPRTGYMRRWSKGYCRSMRPSKNVYVTNKRDDKKFLIAMAGLRLTRGFLPVKPSAAAHRALRIKGSYAALARAVAQSKKGAPDGVPNFCIESVSRPGLEPGTCGLTVYRGPPLFQRLGSKSVPQLAPIRRRQNLYWRGTLWNCGTQSAFFKTSVFARPAVVNRELRG